VGKTSRLQQQFTTHKTFWVDLLDEDLFERYSLKPQLLDAELEQRANSHSLPKIVVIDEVKRAP
jgi:hypothetical protein